MTKSMRRTANLSLLPFSTPPLQDNEEEEEEDTEEVDGAEDEKDDEEDLSEF